MASALNKKFKDNISRWMSTCPKEAILLQEHKCKRLFIIPSKKGEQNLVEKKDGKERLFYSSDNPKEEAEKWFYSLDLYAIKTLIVYGVGLGYYYQAAKKWLEGDQFRRLIFIEDDLEVIHRLFETNLGSELLSDGQVTLLFLENIFLQKEVDEEKEYPLPLKYFVGECKLSTLKCYAETKTANFSFLQMKLDSIKDIELFQTMEFLEYGSAFFSNFYRNLLKVPSSYTATSLQGKFKDIPAIICGAGPSLTKNLSLLKKLDKRALIFAGGSAINAIGFVDLLPHFSVSIDPNPAQYGRFMMNQAYNVPLFYRNRVYPPILDINLGDHIYASGSGGYKIADWFEKDLDIENIESLQEGHDVVNFSLSMAAALGCNPIILVGVDLALSTDKEYAPGILPYPLIDVVKDPSSKMAQEKILGMIDINGERTLTLWKWIMASRWITEFALQNPLCRIINATEGGIGFDGVPNMTLKETAKKYLLKELDLMALTHGEIQASLMPKSVTRDKVLKKMEEMFKSLKKCFDLCRTLENQFYHVFYQIVNSAVSPKQLVTDTSLDCLKKLNDEIAYQNIIKDFNEPFLNFFGKQELKREVEAQQEDDNALTLDRKRCLANKRKYEFFKAVACENMTKMKCALDENMIREVILRATKKRAINKENVSDKIKYVLEKGRIKIKDPEMDIDIDKPICEKPIHRYIENEIKKILTSKRDGKYEILYENGKLKHEFYYKSGHLHGPSTIFSKEEKILAESWYLEGNRIGITRFYYNSGNVHSLRRYKKGLMHGKQQFFYEDGTIKNVLFYKLGKLNGQVLQYYANGGLMRKINFKDGKREGVEEKWYIGGIKEADIEYKNDYPVNVAKGWFINGRPARQIAFDKNSNAVSLDEWSSAGKQLEKKVLRDDYFKKIGEHTDQLTETLTKLGKKTADTSKEMSSTKEIEDLKKDFSELEKELNKLKKHQKDIGKQMAGTTQESKKALWQSSDIQKILKRQVDETKDRLTKDLQSVEETFELMRGILKKKKDGESKK